MIRGKPQTNKHDNSRNDKIVFVMAIAGRFATFLRFLNNYEEVRCIRQVVIHDMYVARVTIFSLKFRTF